MSVTVLKVDGMSCGHCVKSVTDALRSVEGVESADVDLTSGRATVEFDDSRTGSRALVAAVMDAGYAAEEAP